MYELNKLLDKSEVINLDKFILIYNKITLQIVENKTKKKKLIISKYLNSVKFKLMLSTYARLFVFQKLFLDK